MVDTVTLVQAASTEPRRPSPWPRKSGLDPQTWRTAVTGISYLPFCWVLVAGASGAHAHGESTAYQSVRDKYRLTAASGTPIKHIK